MTDATDTPPEPTQADLDLQKEYFAKFPDVRLPELFARARTEALAAQSAEIEKAQKWAREQHALADKYAAEIERLRKDLGEALEVLKGANAALNAAFEQADAELRYHDKAADRHDAVVRAFRESVRALLSRMKGDE